MAQDLAMASVFTNIKTNFSYYVAVIQWKVSCHKYSVITCNNTRRIHVTSMTTTVSAVCLHMEMIFILKGHKINNLTLTVISCEIYETC